MTLEERTEKIRATRHAYYLKHKEKMKAYSKEWYSKHPEKWREYQKRHPEKEGSIRTPITRRIRKRYWPTKRNGEKPIPKSLRHTGKRACRTRYLASLPSVPKDRSQPETSTQRSWPTSSRILPLQPIIRK